MGLAINKANYLREVIGWDQVPDFPLDAELAAMVPDDLPGKLPSTPDEYFSMTQRHPRA